MKRVRGYEQLYSITTKGRVFSHYYKKYLRQFLNEKGYVCVVLSIDSKPKKHKVHRLVAQTYLDNPENHPEVNHIDGKKRNNHYSNLEWCTRRYNMKHAWENGLIKRKKKHGIRVQVQG